MLMNRAVTTHFLPVFFPPHVHASTRMCLISEAEGVGTIDRRVWHMRTFPGATDVRPTHSPTLRKWTREGVGTIDRRVWHMRTFPGATDVRPTHSPTLRKWTSGYGHFTEPWC